MMNRIKSWLAGAGSGRIHRQAHELVSVKSELASKLMEFDRTTVEVRKVATDLRRAAEEVDRRLNGHPR